MRKLGKKKILGLLTAVAIVATTVGSFAVWDNLAANTSKTLTMTNPINTTVTMAEFGNPDTTGDFPVYESEATFTVENVDAAKLATGKITVSTVIKDGETPVTDKFNVSYTDKDGADVAGGVDTGIADGANKYNVKITATDAAKDLAGKSLSVEVTGALSAVK